MGRVKTTTRLEQPAERVLGFVTTPGNWPQRHSSSPGATGATDRPLEPGERVTEECRVAEREAPRRWVIEGRVGDRGGGRISYTPRRRIEAESAEALRRSKRRCSKPRRRGSPGTGR